MTKPSMQSQATLIDLPYELLLHIGSNLDPADLLVVRASCRRVNDMLRAESSRYWMHVGLRKKLQGNTLSKLNRVLPVRSLVIESLRILKPMFLARRYIIPIMIHPNDMIQRPKYPFRTRSTRQSSPSLGVFQRLLDPQAKTTRALRRSRALVPFRQWLFRISPHPRHGILYLSICNLTL